MMMKTKWKAYDLLLVASLLLVTFSYFAQRMTIDLHLHDTYIVIVNAHVAAILGIVLAAAWLLYKLTFRLLFSGFLVTLHLIVTLVPVFAVTWLLYFTTFNTGTAPARSYDYSKWSDYYQRGNYADIIFIFICVFLFGQAIYLLNLIAGLVRLLVKKEKAS